MQESKSRGVVGMKRISALFLAVCLIIAMINSAGLYLGKRRREQFQVFFIDIIASCHAPHALECKDNSPYNCIFYGTVPDEAVYGAVK